MKEKTPVKKQRIIHPKFVTWNREHPEFQTYWLWQFGPEPFHVLDVMRVPRKTFYLGELETNRIAIKYEPGYWYVISVPDSIWTKEYGSRIVSQTMFHGKWFRETP